MNKIYTTVYSVPGANLNGVNPLPSLRSKDQRKDPDFSDKVDSSVPAEDSKYFGYGRNAGILPYRLRDKYDRARNQIDFKAIVLENDLVKATFLPESGGKLISLVNKNDDRELLYVNPVYQPGNLAIRNAWCSGGIEWNGAVRGHSVHTEESIFAAKIIDDSGNIVLRMYEYNRIRRVPMMMDFYLKEGLPFVFARMTTFNPYDRQLPMYWFSNAGVPETEDTRVIVPAEKSFYYAYREKIGIKKVPYINGMDVSYATNIQHSCDYFYHIPETQTPWEAAVTKDGKGIVNISTKELKGRKMFVWGMADGGRRWQEFLSVPNKPYIEIQSGITRTQDECRPMPPKSTITWLEAWGNINVDSEKTHGDDWAVAQKEVQTKLYEMIEPKWLDDELARGLKENDKAPEEMLHLGDGWGALENIKRKKLGEESIEYKTMDFKKEAMDDECKDWLSLLETGILPKRDVTETPGAYMNHPEWIDILKKAIDDGKSDHWLAWLHLGVMYHDNQQYDQAKNAWLKANEIEESAWAYRNLAVMAAHEKDFDKSMELYSKTCQLLTTDVSLIIEAGQAMTNPDRKCSEQFLTLYESFSDEVKAHSRIQIWRVKAAYNVGQLDLVNEILTADLDFSDIREGERTLSDLWFAMHAKRMAKEEGLNFEEHGDELTKKAQKNCPPPKAIDFRMNVD